MEDSKYEDAKEAFKNAYRKVNNYKDTRDLIDQCENEIIYIKAVDAMNDKNILWLKPNFRNWRKTSKTQGNCIRLRATI